MICFQDFLCYFLLQVTFSPSNEIVSSGKTSRNVSSDGDERTGVEFVLFFLVRGLSKIQRLCRGESHKAGALHTAPKDRLKEKVKNKIYSFLQ